MTRSIHPRRTARGFSLLELMIAVAISMMLLMGVVALFVSSRASYETTEKLSRIQENGRYALDQITSDIRMAGYQGCSRAVGSGSRREDYSINTLMTPNHVLWNFPLPVQGFQGMGGAAFMPNLDDALDPVGLPAPAPSGAADVLFVRIPLRDTLPMRLTADQGEAINPLQVGAINPPPVNGPAMITDCLARAWFQITGYDGAQLLHEDTGNTSPSLDHSFMLGSEVVPLMTVMYYLAPRDPAQPQRLSLYRREGTNPSEELAEGIDQLEIRYGVDTTGDSRVDNYVDADMIPVLPGGAPNWASVYSVQIALLARAPEAYGNDLDGQQYTLLGAANGANPITVGPFNDRFQRKVFTATAAVRNQIID